MKRRGLSIKYKILLLLTLVPLLTLGLYLVLAIKIFENDKLAYVFENGSAMSRTLSSQSTTDLNSVLINAKPMIQEYLLERQFGKVTRSVLDSEGKVDWIAVYGVPSEENPQNLGAAPTVGQIPRTTVEKIQRLGLAEKLAGIGSRDLQSFGDITPLLVQMQKQNRLIRIPFKDDRVLIVEKVEADGEGTSAQDTKYFMLMSKLPDLANAFRTPGAAEFYLINEQGLVLFGPAGSEATYLSLKMPINFLADSKAQNLTAGTELVKTADGKNFLASFSRMSFGDLAVVTVMDRAEALRAVDLLLVRSLVFFVLIISVSVIVSLFASGTLTRALTELFNATKQVAEGDFGIRVKVNSSDEIGSLGDSFNAMAEEVSRLMGETAEKARMESELKTAQTVQETLFPPTIADLGGMRIAGYYEPASECGGDWWHYSKVDKKVSLWIGDATGHGAPAALITSAAKSAATIIERLNVDPAHALQLLNRAIYDVSKGQIMMTFFLASYDIETKQLTYANASHEGPYLFKKKDGEIKKRDLIPLNDVINPRLGQERDTVYDQVVVDMEPGDRILFYTDGIPDIENPEKKSWGEREFIKGIITTNQGFPPVTEAVHQLVDMFSSYRKKAPLKDDITFFMAEFTGEA